MKKILFFLFPILIIAGGIFAFTQWGSNEYTDGDIEFPDLITVDGVAQNPEGIEYNTANNTFFLSSLNAGPIIKVNLDGTYTPFTSGEPFPLSSAGLQIDAQNNRLLATGFNGMELMDEDPTTKGVAFLRIYNLESGAFEKDVNLSALAPNADMYFANDIAVDTDGNVYITDWYANVIYKVDTEGNASLFWENNTGKAGGPNGIDFHKDGYLLVSLVRVNEKGLYDDFALARISVKNPESTRLVEFENNGFTGFDGMVLTHEGKVVGVTNDGKTPGGNTLVELSTNNGWENATIEHTQSITPSTTVATTPGGKNYVINQDFLDSFGTTWKIQRILF